MDVRSRVVPLVLVALLTGGSGPSASGPGSALVKLAKAEIVLLPPSLAAEVRGVEELGDAWLAQVSEAALARLSRRGVSFEVLDDRPVGKSYFLVFAPLPGDERVLSAYGGAIDLGEGTCLFWTDGREAREALPSRFEIKSLSLEVSRPVTAKEASAAASHPFGGILKPSAFDPEIGNLAAQVLEARLSRTILDLQGFQTRYANTSQCDAAASYLAEEFARLGLAVESDPFSFSANNFKTRNIVATLPGKASPEYVVIVCGHFDSTSNQAATLAPGADDNASGTAAVLEIARILAGRSFDLTLKFVAFSAEEWGLYGSKHYAQEAKARKEKIVAVLNLDMIAYTDRLPEDLDLIVNEPSQWLFNRFAICAALYAPLDLLKVVNANFKYSDHSPFWDQGYSALLGIEDAGVPNPFYHRPGDTYSTLNMDFAVAVTKLTLAVAAGLAQPYGR